MRRNSIALYAMGVVFMVGRVHGIDIPLVTIGDAGNQADVTGMGSVSYEYRIGKYEVTNVEYAAFLNAVAQTDPHGLWSPAMAADAVNGSISRQGEPGSYSYTVDPSMAGLPATGITIWRAARFANWMHNGQPVGPQGPGTTEDGAYTLTPEAIAGNTWQRNAGARYFLPSADEWYKAAYYKGHGSDAGYWLYPTQSDDPPLAEFPSASANTANFDSALVTSVGSYPASIGPYGTFDQAGNVVEWTDTIAPNTLFGEVARYALGGHFETSSAESLVSSHLGVGYAIPTGILANYSYRGFRIASIPEPGALTLLLIAVLLLPHPKRWMVR